MGARLGRYVMLKHLASGGMADVWLGRSDGLEGFERHVVVKRIKPELARDQRFIRMFLDEARVAATLHHQHIVQVHDVGESAGEHFIAMEYVHGEDVRRILSNASRQRTHMPLGYAVAIVSAAAAGLHYAHERSDSDKQPLNIVHRDVSPSNILVGYDGSIKVVDFGIATATMRQETRSGSLKGKLSYMSPEQCRGQMVDRRSDVYALGVVLYELATTTRMIKGDNDYLVMEQIVSGRISPPRSRRPNLPTELADIIMRALTPERDRRYATADDLRLALDRFAANAGLIASTSAIAAYMRQQFGQRPEPWLDLDVQIARSLDELPVPSEESMPSNSWVEAPRSDADRRRTSSVAPHSGPLGVIASELPEPAVQTRPPQRPSIPQAPTDSRMGWESRQPAAPQRFPIQKAAMIGGALVAGLAIWFVASARSKPDAPAAPPAVPPAPLVAAAAAPAPAPPPPAADVVTAASVNSTYDDEPARDAGTQVTRRTRSAPISRQQPANRTAPEPPPSAKNPVQVATASATPARVEPAVVDTELHRPAAPPPPPPPDPTPAPVAPPPPATPATPAGPQVVTPAALDANRISGDKRIIPDAATMDAIGRSGKDTLVSSYKVCVSVDGSINGVTQLRGTGFPAYDAKIQSTIQRDWRYRPYLVSGKPTPVCTAFRFMYSQKSG